MPIGTGYWCNSFFQFNFVGSWHNDERNIFGFAGYYDGIIYVSWRGTIFTDIVGWLGNLDMVPVSYPGVDGAKVHEGFLLNYQSVRDQAREVIEAAKNACPLCTRVVVAGHSLGGALATLNSLDIATWLNIPASSVTMLSFSGPRVGNAEFVNFFQNTVFDAWTVVNSCDMVPHVPSLLLGYIQATPEIWWNGLSWRSCEKAEDRACSTSCFLFNAFDHAIIMGENVLLGTTSGCFVYKV